MPISAVSGEPRCVEAQNGADLAGAQPCGQTVEAGARHGSACWPAEIVVDDFDVDEPALASNVDDARGPLHLKELARRSLLHATHQNLPAKIGVTPVTDCQLLPHTGAE